MELRKEHEETTNAPSHSRVRRALHVIPAPAPDETGDGALQSMGIGALDLELGGRLDSVTLAYRTWGTLNEAGDNAILVVHALTGDSKAAGEDGWWEPLIGPGRPLDTDHAFVVCSNVIGGCQGSTGPSSIDPLTGRPYAMRFPLITIGDMVNAQRRLVERLGISRLVVAGGSIGGFQALEWATRHADLVAASIPIAATESLSAQGIAVHSEIGRRAIMADPNWRGGEYASEGVFPTEGLAIARMAAMTTYHSNESMAMRFGRTPATRPGIYPSFGGTFDVEGYLHYQGAKLVRRFDANSYLYLTRAMDLYDLGRNGGEAYWLRQIAAPVLLVGIRSDWLFPPEGVRELAERINEAGGDARYAELDSPHGHDAFLKEWDMLDSIIRPFIAQTPAGDVR
ncbi:MAG TPA: homoserine O-acetyltransferase [Thermomicrobiales bacterium]|nr:homoserine O-acetyltransferase [Thermomicrobiales bacterium]